MLSKFSVGDLAFFIVVLCPSKELRCKLSTNENLSGRLRLIMCRLYLMVISRVVKFSA